MNNRVTAVATANVVDAVNLRARMIAQCIVLHSKICLVRYTLVSLACTVVCANGALLSVN